MSATPAPLASRPAARLELGPKLGPILFFAVFAAALVAALLVVRARTPDLTLEVTGFEPARRVLAPADDAAGDGGPPLVRITFFVRESDDSARVAILDSDGDPVRVLASGVPLAANRPVTYAWDGRTEDGEIVAPGRYQLEVTLPGHDREMAWPRRIIVVDGERDSNRGSGS